MTDLDLEQLKEHKDNLNSILILQAANMSETDISEAMIEDVKDEKTIQLLISLGDKLTEMGVSFFEDARKIFNDESSAEDALKNLVKEKGYDEEMAEYLELDITWRLMFESTETAIIESLESGASSDGLIKEFSKILGKDAATVFVGCAITRIGPTKLNLINQKGARKKGKRNIGWGVFWFAIGLIATIATDGETLYYGAMVIGAIYVIIGLVKISSN